MNKNLLNKNLLKHILIPGIGFGIGGMIWGFFLHQSIFTGENFPIFSYWLPALILGALAGLVLGILYKDTKKIPRIILLEMIGFFIAFLTGAIVTYPGVLFGSALIPLGLISSSCPDQVWESLSGLKPSLRIGDLFLVFAAVGGIIGILNSFIFKKKILRLACYGAIGFALGSLIGPIIGNGILNLFGSLFLTYITTFFIICAFLGMFLGLGIYKSSILKAPDKKL